MGHARRAVVSIMKCVEVKVKRLPAAFGLPMPKQMSDHAAGVDLYAALQSEVIIAPGARMLVGTGLCMAIPEGYEGQVRPRSGLALKNGVTVLNAPGTIDSDYRGEVGVILINLGEEPFALKRGDRIAQLVIAPVTAAVLSETDELPPTRRGEGGFGHTGLS